MFMLWLLEGHIPSLLSLKEMAVSDNKITLMTDVEEFIVFRRET